MIFAIENVELNVSLGYQDAESKEAIVSSCLELGSTSWRDVDIL